MAENNPINFGSVSSAKQISDYPSLSNLASASSARALADIFSKLHRNGLYYHRKLIQLDGMTFEDCAFENCKFVTETGSFTLRNCRIYGPETIFEYSGNARKIASMYEFMNAAVNGKTIFPNLFPTLDKDGRVTI